MIKALEHVFTRLERWIGGIYNWETKHWVWGATGEDLVHQGFSRQNPNTDHKWHCIMMDPTNYYRWNAKSCVHKKHYICETPLKKVRKKGNKKLARKQKKNTNINKLHLHWSRLSPDPTRPDWIRLPDLIQPNSRAYTGAVFRLTRPDWIRLPSLIQPDSRAYTGVDFRLT
uniref:C-type lectin domain-containing protein n=1 Tax=Timema tahoe TaxID=61484 RepID=A0A7R9IPF8_9NEOP|nr:unnamed protein product [Timema tahoe]